MSTKAIIFGLLIVLSWGAAPAGPIRQLDLSVTSAWAAHLDVAKLQDSPLGELVLGTVGFDRVLELEVALKEELSLELNAIESVTLYGAGEQGRETVVLVRGRFDEIDTDILPLAEGAPSYRGVVLHKGPQWQEASLLVGCRSKTELVAGTSKEAIRESLDVLAGRHHSWERTAVPEHARKELASATVLLGLDLEALGAELEFEADFTRSVRRAWFLIGSREERVEATILIDGTDAESLARIRSQLDILSMILAGGEDASAAPLGLLSSLQIQSQGNWLTVKVSASPEETAQFLKALAPLFQEAAVPPGSSK